MKLNKILITFTICLITNIANAQSASELRTIIEKTVKITAVPSNATYTNNSWEVLEKTFPKQVWKNIGHKEFSEAKVLDVAKNIKIIVGGNRTMIVSTQLFIEGDLKHDLFKILKESGKVLEIRCDSKEIASFVEKYLEMSFSNSKPLKIYYEFSSGASSSMTSVIFNNSLILPKISAQAVGGVWTNKCQ
jgi:hypothetical protein